MKMLVVLSMLAARAIACTPIEGDRILGSDLARADARFASVPAGFVAGLAPLPGVQRLFEARDLARIARSHGLEADGLRALCFERISVVLTEGRLRGAMQPLLPPNARLEIVDFSRNALPSGELTFATSDLARPPVNDPAAAVLWRGRVLYGSNGSVLIWAKVRILAKERWVETVRTIPAGRPIEAADLAVREAERFPFAAPPALALEAVIGKAASRTLARGQVLTDSLLATAPDVRSGEAVNVEVASGGVRLRFPARALSSGRVDDLILVALDSGRKLRAIVRERGRVQIDAAK